MNQSTLNHLRALEAHHLEVLNSVRKLIALEGGQSLDPAIISPVPEQPVRSTAPIRQSPRLTLEMIVLETLSALEQDNFDTTDVLRAIKHKFPDEFIRWHHTSFSRELGRIAETGVIRVEVPGAGRRATTYSK